MKSKFSNNIVQLDHFKPHKDLVEVVKKFGDENFTSSLDARLNDYKDFLPKLPKNFRYSDHSGILLKIGYVGPHIDPDVGSLRNDWSMFMIFNEPGSAHLQVGEEHVGIYKNQPVLFRDTILHSFYAKRKVYALAVQVQEND